MNLSNPLEIDKLNIDEKILILEELWEKISCSGEKITVPQSHVTEMKKRLKDYDLNPGNLLTIKELRANIEKRK